MLWTALVFLFLTGAAALAVDVSGAFNVAQTDQNTADLACLAGVIELPDDATAINVAYAYTVANWPEMAGLSASHSGYTATYADGAGNEIFIDARYGGNSSRMQIHITEMSETFFGKTMGQDEIQVEQEATCSGQSVRTGTGLLPIGALPGSWSGDLFDCAKKVTGNCGALRPNGNGANAYRDAVANGIDGDFIKHHGNKNLPDPDTGFATIDCFAIPCNVTKTEPGNMVGPWNQALNTRFNDPTATCKEAGWFNCDSLTVVLGETPVPLLSAPPGTDTTLGWQNSLYGPYVVAQASTLPNARHYYFNGDNLNCDSVRLATIPIVNKDLNWDLGNAASTWPNGQKDMKMIGYYTIYIREPSTIAAVGGPMSADIIWFGPEAKCSTGEAFKPFGSSVVLDLGVKLVAP